MDVRGNLRLVRDRISAACLGANRDPAGVTLIAITKNVAPGPILEAFGEGVRHFGENRVQEAALKLPQLGAVATSATWHMVGHLQSNKAKRALELFHCIDSVDSVRLAGLLNSHALRKTPVLLQINVAGESTKEGLPVENAADAANQIRAMGNLELRGLMTIAPLTADPEEVRPVFRRLRELRDSLGLPELSMGMSDDFEAAIQEGATMVRIGRGIFGGRKT